MSLTSAPKCKVCGFNHWLRDPHKWPDEPVSIKEIVSTLTKRVHNPKKKAEKRVHNTEKPKDVYTIRQVSIRQFRMNMSKELSSLPFEIVRSGKVIAKVVVK